MRRIVKRGARLFLAPRSWAWRRVGQRPKGARIIPFPALGCPYGHDWCGGRGFCGYERWGRP